MAALFHEGRVAEALSRIRMHARGFAYRHVSTLDRRHALREPVMFERAFHVSGGSWHCSCSRSLGHVATHCGTRSKMRFPVFSGKTMSAVALAAACTCALFPASAATVAMHSEPRQVSDSSAYRIDCDRAMLQRVTAGEEQIPCGNPAQNDASDDAMQRRREAAVSDERLREQRLRDEQLHEQRVHDERMHEERVHEERVHEERLRAARSHRYRSRG